MGFQTATAGGKTEIATKDSSNRKSATDMGSNNVVVPSNQVSQTEIPLLRALSGGLEFEQILNDENKKRFNELSESQQVTQKFMQGAGTPKDFLKSVSFTIHLNQLFQVKDYFFYSENFQYASVLLEIVNHDLQQVYKGKYLLQVWQKEGKLVFQRVLKYEVAIMAVYSEAFLYITDPKEEEEEEEDEDDDLGLNAYLFDRKVTIKITDWPQLSNVVYLGYFLKGKFIVTLNDGTIQMINLINKCKEAKEGDTLKVRVNEEKIKIFENKIPSTMKFHCLFENSYSRNDEYILSLIEREDNILQTTRIYSWSDSDELSFYPYREVFGRPIQNDPVVKFRMYINSGEYQYAVSLRQSGKVDLYYNYSLSTETNDSYEDIEISGMTIFGLKKNQKNGELEVFSIKGDENNPKVSFDSADSLGKCNKRWNMYRFESMKTFIKIYSQMFLSQNAFFVAHTKYISIFDLFSNRWVKTFEFDYNVVSMYLFNDYYTDSTIKIKILLVNGEKKLLTQNVSEDIHQWSFIENSANSKIEGKILKIVNDYYQQDNCYILAESQEDKSMVCLYTNAEGCIRCVNSELPKEGTQLIGYQCYKDQRSKCFAVYQQPKNILSIYHPDGWKIMEIQLPEEVKFVGNLEYIVENNNGQKPVYYIYNGSGMYIIRVKGGGDDSVSYSVRYIGGIYFSSSCFVDDKFVYAIHNQSSTQDSGLYIHRLELLFDEENEKSHMEKGLKLKNAIGGYHNMLTYLFNEKRIAYQSDFSKIKIIPLVHSNLFTFFGMRSRMHYIAARRIDDAFITLDRSKVLATWSLSTGKMVYSKKIEDPQLDFTGYSLFENNNNIFQSVYLKSWYQNNVLLCNTSQEVQVDQKEFFKDRRNDAINNGQHYIDIETHTFYPFQVIEIVSPEQVKVHFHFNHPKYSFQKIYFSDDHSSMLEQLQNHKIFLYQREDVDIENKIVKWNIVRVLRNLPMSLMDLSAFNILFSPNLQYYLDYSNQSNSYQIMRSANQSLAIEIPSGYLSPLTDKPEELVKRFLWLSNTEFKILDREGYEKVFEIQRGNKCEDINLKVVSYGKLPTLDFEVINKQIQKYHFFEDFPIIGTKKQFQRLLRRLQMYVSEENKQSENSLEVRRQKLFDHIFTVDMNCTNDKMVYLEMSFTYLHWKFAETISQENKKHSIDMFPPYVIKLLCLNIFPNGNTIMHYIYNDSSEIQSIYEAVTKISPDETNIFLQIPFQVPFLKNFEGKSALHKCFEEGNFQSINSFLYYLRNDHPDNHSRAIIDLIPKFLDAELPALGPYLNSRFIITEKLGSLNRGNLKRLYNHIDDQIHSCEMWPDLLSLKEAAIEKAEQVIEKDLRFMLLDLPEIQSFQGKHHKEFFNELSLVSNMDIFKNEAIKALIDFKWPIIKEFTIKKMFIPFLFYLAIFITFSNVFNGQVSYDDDEERQAEFIKAKIVLISFLYALSAYTWLHEIVQFYRQGIIYFLSIWNLLDVCLPVIVCVVISFHLAECILDDYQRPPFVNAVHCACSLQMWLKFLYFLRIFKHTGHFIRLLLQVMWDIKIFLLILLILYLGFGEAFLRLSETSEEGFITDFGQSLIYAFNLSIGETATDAFENSVIPPVAWLLYVLCAVMLNVIMLNLLISIISDSYATINGNAEQANYQERASLISENSYLIPKHRKIQFSAKSNYLVKAQELVEELDKKAMVSEQSLNETLPNARPEESHKPKIQLAQMLGANLRKKIKMETLLDDKLKTLKNNIEKTFSAKIEENHQALEAKLEEFFKKMDGSSKK